MQDAAVTVHDTVTGASGPPPFGDRVAHGVAARETQLVLGLDPDPERLWPDAFELGGAAEGARAGGEILAQLAGKTASK